MVGSPQLVRAWLDGDWSAIEGAFFTEWDEAKHVVTPFDIPDTWLRFRSGDWGSYSPFSFGWWAVATDDFALPCNPEMDFCSAQNSYDPMHKRHVQRSQVTVQRDSHYSARGARPLSGMVRRGRRQADGGPGRHRHCLARDPRQAQADLRRARPLGLHRERRPVDCREHQQGVNCEKNWRRFTRPTTSGSPATSAIRPSPGRWAAGTSCGLDYWARTAYRCSTCFRLALT